VDLRSALQLLASLEERIEADSQRAGPLFAGHISSREREALRLVLKTFPEIELKEQPAAQHETISATPPGVSPSSAASRQRGPQGFTLNVDAVSKSPFADDLILCFDFGTARSKAFAATQDDDPELFDIPLGKLDGDNESVYGLNSAVWIEPSGQVFVGEEAFRRSIAGGFGNASKHKRLDSIKEQLSQITASVDLSKRRLEEEYNPSSIPLSYEQVITFYLSYLTELATTYLEGKRLSRYAKRRFTLPWWEDTHRKRAQEELARYICRAQVLADTFRGSFKEGIFASEISRITQEASLLDGQLSHLLAVDEKNKTGAVLEPLAAGSARLLKERDSAELVLIVDTGAGTTDISLFFVVQIATRNVHEGHPVEPCGCALKFAGNKLDSFLVEELVKNAPLGYNDSFKKLAAEHLWHIGIRPLKERLFETGQVQVALPNDLDLVSLTLEEFLASDGVQRFQSTLEATIQKFLDKVDPSWANVSSSCLVLTGGGATLPMVSRLADVDWRIGDRTRRFRRTSLVPDFIKQAYDADFQREYPSLAVSIGGSYTLVDESRPYSTFMGGAHPPARAASWT
jgi:molecular chaperone HscA